MKRISITIDKESEAILEWAKKEKGMTQSGAIRISLRAYFPKVSGETSKNPENAPGKKEIAIPQKVKDDLENYKLDKALCPIHPSRMPSQCQCLENGALLEYLMKEYA